MKNLRQLLALVALAPLGIAQDTVLLSQGPNGQANGSNANPRSSLDGRFVVWQTQATNLVPQDTNPTWDVVLLDRETGQLELISQAMNGLASSGSCFDPEISDDGRFVVFRATAGDFLPGHGFGVYLWDRQTQTMAAASTSANVPGFEPKISGNGRYVVYTTNRPLVPEDTNAKDDVYRYDRVSQEILLVSTDAAGTQSARDCQDATVSRNGNWIAFDSWSANWGAGFADHGHVWVKNMETGALEAVSTTEQGVPANGLCGDAEISADGRWVTFEAGGDNLFGQTQARQVAVKNLIDGTLLLASQNNFGALGDQYSQDARISADGRFVAFRSLSTNLPMGGTGGKNEIWVRDTVEGVTRKISLASAALGGVSGSDDSYPGTINITGRWLAFSSEAPNLTPDDLNGLGEDIFMRDHWGSTTHTYGQPYPQILGCVPRLETSGTPSASAPSGFDVKLTGTRGSQPGLLVYSRTGPAATPLLGSLLYVSTPVVRTSPQFSGGTAGVCDGQFSFDFNSWMSAGMDPNLSAGSPVWAQYWTRNPGDPDGAYLSEAVEFTIQP